MVEPKRKPRHAIVLAGDPVTWSKPPDQAKAMLRIGEASVLQRLLGDLQTLEFESCTIIGGRFTEDLQRAFGQVHRGLRLNHASGLSIAGLCAELERTGGDPEDDVHLFRGDLICSGDSLKSLLAESPANLALVASSHTANLRNAAKLDSANHVIDIVEFGTPTRDNTTTCLAPLVGAFRFTAAYKEDLLHALSELPQQAPFTIKAFLTALGTACRNSEIPLHAASCDGLWHLIEEPVDLEAAAFLFSSAAQRAAMIDEMYGGYWRVPIAEHVLLCNIYFPPQDLLDRVTRRLHDLIALYPSGQRRMAEGVADLTGQPPDTIAVGNGVSELIRALYGELQPTLAISTPSFIEFINAWPSDRVRCFGLAPPEFDLDVDAFADFALAQGATAAVVVNPNNPTGRLVSPDALLRLAERLRVGACRLIVDESFIDFTDEPVAPSLESAAAGDETLIVLKSLGKIYGLGGVRAGYLVSGDCQLIQNLRTNLPIWNVNGIAEYVLTLLPMYRTELAASCLKMRSDRKHLHKLLLGLSGFDVIASQTNYLFCKLPDHWPDGPAVTERLLREHGILIRNCAYQPMPEADRYVRIAARTAPENERLLHCLSSLDLYAHRRRWSDVEPRAAE